MYLHWFIVMRQWCVWWPTFYITEVNNSMLIIMCKCTKCMMSSVYLVSLFCVYDYYVFTETVDPMASALERIKSGVGLRRTALLSVSNLSLAPLQIIIHLVLVHVSPPFYSQRSQKKGTTKKEVMKGTAIFVFTVLLLQVLGLYLFLGITICFCHSTCRNHKANFEKIEYREKSTLCEFNQVKVFLSRGHFSSLATDWWRRANSSGT